MSISSAELSIVTPALAVGALVLATHVPLGMQVLSRGIVFIDLAIAQIAGLGVILAALLGYGPEGWAVQISAFGTAIVGALALNWTEKRYAEAQEPIIGVVFILAATAGVLLLSGNVHAGESLRDLLVGQILWVNPERLPYAALVYAIVLAIWFSLRERIGRLGFYLLFACTVTVSVQLVGVYLVFASLIIPPLAIRRLSRYRLPWSYAIGALGYGLGISASVLFDLPTGPIIVWTLAVLGILAHTAIKPNAASGVAASLTVGTEGTRSGS